jgi:hypothetical protein
MEALADASLDPSAEERAHLDACERCRGLADARAIEQAGVADVAALRRPFTTA